MTIYSRDKVLGRRYILVSGSNSEQSVKTATDWSKKDTSDFSVRR